MRTARVAVRVPGERGIPPFATDDSTCDTPFGPGLRVAFDRGATGNAASADVKWAGRSTGPLWPDQRRENSPRVGR